eukprot:Opistho-1_new@25161
MTRAMAASHDSASAPDSACSTRDPASLLCASAWHSKTFGPIFGARPHDESLQSGNTRFGVASPSLRPRHTTSSAPRKTTQRRFQLLKGPRRCIVRSAPDMMAPGGGARAAAGDRAGWGDAGVPGALAEDAPPSEPDDCCVGGTRSPCGASGEFAEDVSVSMAFESPCCGGRGAVRMRKRSSCRSAAIGVPSGRPSAASGDSAGGGAMAGGRVTGTSKRCELPSTSAGTLGRAEWSHGRVKTVASSAPTTCCVSCVCTMFGGLPVANVTEIAPGTLVLKRTTKTPGLRFAATAVSASSFEMKPQNHGLSSSRSMLGMHVSHGDVHRRKLPNSTHETMPS